jgi:hypothetical protein
MLYAILFWLSFLFLQCQGKRTHGDDLCNRMKEQFFDDVQPHHLIRDEFERFLPVYIKTQRNLGAKFDSRQEDHNIFDLLGPTGK